MKSMIYDTTAEAKNEERAVSGCILTTKQETQQIQDMILYSKRD